MIKYRSILNLVLSAAFFAWATSLGVIPGLTRDARAELPTLKIASASDLQFAMADLIQAFKAAHPNDPVKVTYGTSESFASQIEAGSSYDVFFADETSYTSELEKKGLASDGKSFEYGQGHLALWIRAGKAGAGDLKAFKALKADKIRTIAIANPEHSAYGKAAVAALKAAGVYAAVQDKLVFSDSVALAAQQVQKGAADAGLVALALLKAPKVGAKAGSFASVPDNLSPPLHQSAAILISAQQLNLAEEFIQLVLSSQGKAILGKYGISPPAPKKQ